MKAYMSTITNDPGNQDDARDAVREARMILADAGEPFQRDHLDGLDAEARAILADSLAAFVR